MSEIKKENSLLNKLDIKEINNRKRRTEKAKELYKANKEKNNLNAQIEIDKISSESSKLDAMNNIAPKKIKNARTENQLSQLERAIGFNKTINENHKREIKRTLKRGKRFKRISMIASIVSAVTTCLGINGMMENWMYYICCGMIIFCAIAVNMNINSTVEFIKKFFSGKADASLLSLKLILVVGYTTYSIMTNFDFWQTYLTGISVVMFALIFDVIAIEMSIEGEKLINLEYNQKYKDEINEIMSETTKYEIEENTPSKKKRGVA